VVISWGPGNRNSIPGGPWVQRSGSQGEPFDEPVDGLPQRGIFAKKDLDLADRVQDRCVICAAEGAADLGERGMGELPRKMHGDLTRKGHGFRPILGVQLGERDPEELGNLPLYQLDRDDRPPVIAPTAIIRVNEPSSWRMFDLTRLAIR